MKASITHQTRTAYGGNTIEAEAVKLVFLKQRFAEEEVLSSGRISGDGEAAVVLEG